MKTSIFSKENYNMPTNSGLISSHQHPPQSSATPSDPIYMTAPAPLLSWPLVGMEPCSSTSFTRPWASAPYYQAPLWPLTTQVHTNGLQDTPLQHLVVHFVTVHTFFSIAPSHDGVSMTKIPSPCWLCILS